MQPKISIWNQRMLQLMRHCIDLSICESQKDFLEGIGFVPTNLRQVKDGTRGFTMDQIFTACKKYKVSMNWIAGFDNEMRLKKPANSLIVLKDAVRNMEVELAGK